MDRQVYVIYYKYKGRTHTSITRPCTLAEATAAFHEELNSLNTFKLLRIVAK